MEMHYLQTMPAAFPLTIPHFPDHIQYFSSFHKLSRLFLKQSLKNIHWLLAQYTHRILKVTFTTLYNTIMFSSSPSVQA